jgi:Uma2 family endonuclease
MAGGPGDAATITPMAFTLGDRPVRPLTADEVLRMVEAGILGGDRRVELLRGVLTEVSPKSPQHAAIKARIARWLDAAVPRYAVRIGDPLVVPDPTSLPEPDIAVVEPGDNLQAHPAAALLVIEVAFSSLEIDAQIKPELYAAAGVPDYWVVDGVAKRVRVFREPRGDGYASRAVLGPGGFAEPVAVDVPPLDLAELFRGL